MGGRSGFGTPPPLFFPSPENWLFCTSGLIQTRGIFSRAPLSPCEPLKRSRDGGKKSAGKKFIFPNLGTGTGFRNRPGLCVYVFFSLCVFFCARARNFLGPDRALNKKKIVPTLRKKLKNKRKRKINNVDTKKANGRLLMQAIET